MFAFGGKRTSPFTDVTAAADPKRAFATCKQPMLGAGFGPIKGLVRAVTMSLLDLGRT
jgi:hypothetical protein